MKTPAMSDKSWTRSTFQGFLAVMSDKSWTRSTFQGFLTVLKSSRLVASVNAAYTI